MNNYPKGNDLIVRWKLLYSDGGAFPLSNYAYELSYSTARGVCVVTDTALLSVDGNMLAWKFPATMQNYNGAYSLQLRLFLDGKVFATLGKREAFALYESSSPSTSVVELSSYVDMIAPVADKYSGIEALRVAKIAEDTANEANDLSTETREIVDTKAAKTDLVAEKIEFIYCDDRFDIENVGQGLERLIWASNYSMEKDNYLNEKILDEAYRLDNAKYNKSETYSKTEVNNLFSTRVSPLETAEASREARFNAKMQQYQRTFEEDQQDWDQEIFYAISTMNDNFNTKSGQIDAQLNAKKSEIDTALEAKKTEMDGKITTAITTMNSTFAGKESERDAATQYIQENATEWADLSQKVNELDTTINGSHTEEEITTTLTNNGYIARSNGVVTSATSTWRHSDIIPIDKFVSGGKYVSHASVAQVAFYKANEISQANYLGYMAIDGNKTITKDEVVAYANANYPTATHIVLSSNSTTSYGAFVLVYKQGADVDGIVDKIVIDATLTIENRPADAKAVGNEISALKEDIKVYTKFAHLSLDDCTFWTDLIDNENTYTSCFQNPKLAALKAYHDTYGCTFTLNCFIVSGDYSIANVPSKFASEFKAAKGWLRFAFHGTTTTEYFDTDNVEVIKGYYNTFVDAIYQMTGDYDCIDRFTRLSSFTGSVNNVVALSNCACGVRGLLTSDFAMGASGVNYYLNNAQKTYISTHCKLFDATNQIYFLRSLPRIENIKDPNDLATKTYQNISPFVELFWHETANWLTNYFKNNFTIPWLQYLKDNGYKFCFPMDMLY